jgi:uncharacterized OB-fold protein
MDEARAVRIPIEEGFFTIPDDTSQPPRLLGSRCRACGEHFFPRRVVCASCLAQDTDEVLLGPCGTLYTYTYVHVPLFGSQRADHGGYGVGQVDLPEGPRVPLSENQEGQEVVIYRFRPRDPGAPGEVPR